MKRIKAAFLIIGVCFLLCLAGCSNKTGKKSESDNGQAGVSAGEKANGSSGGSVGENALGEEGASDEVPEPDGEKIWLCTRQTIFFPDLPNQDRIKRFFYDDKGNQVKEECYDQAQNLIYVMTYGGFLEDGRPTWYEKEDYVGDDSYHYEYVLEDGMITGATVKSIDNTDFLDQNTKYKRDERGNICEIEIYHQGELVSSYQYCLEYEYDEEERLIKMSEHATGGRMIRYTEYEYNEDGNLSKEALYDARGTLIDTRTFFYDEHGNEIREEFRDAQGKLIQKIVSKYEQFTIKK